jgi:hypothetical protein
LWPRGSQTNEETELQKEQTNEETELQKEEAEAGEMADLLRRLSDDAA